MSDDIRIYTNLDRLPPMEKTRDSPKGVVDQETSKKRKKGRHEPGLTDDMDQEKSGESDGPSKDQHSGKILDIVI